MGDFLAPEDWEPRDYELYKRIIEAKHPIELVALTYHSSFQAVFNHCHFARSRMAAKHGLPVYMYNQLAKDEYSSVVYNLLENPCPNAAEARYLLRAQEKRALSLLREHRRPLKTRMPWGITKEGARYYRYHWSLKVRKVAHKHPKCPGSFNPNHKKP